MAAGHRSRARQGVFLLPANTHGHLPRGLPRNVTKDAGAGLFSVCMCTASCGLAALHSLVRGRRRVYLAEVAVSGWWRPCTKELRVLVLRHAVLGFYLALARRFRLERVEIGSGEVKLLCMITCGRVSSVLTLRGCLLRAEL